MSQNKSALRVVKLNLWIIFIHRGIRNKKFGKLKTFQVYVDLRFYKEGAKNHSHASALHIVHVQGLGTQFYDYQCQPAAIVKRYRKITTTT